MEAICINRNLTKQEEAEILDKLSTGKNYELYTNVKVSEELSSFTKGPIELTPEEKRKINYDIFEKVIRFGEIKIKGQAITDSLMVEKASIWHYHKFRTYFYIRNLFFEIELLEKLSNTYKNIFYYTGQNALANYSFSSSGIRIVPAVENPAKPDKLSLLNYFLFFFLRSISSFFLGRKIKNKKHILIDHSIKQTCLNLNTLKPEQGNYNLQYLFEKMNDDFILLEDVEIPKFQKENRFRFNTKLLKPKKNLFFGETVLFRGIISREVRGLSKTEANRIWIGLNKIKRDLKQPFEVLIIDHLLTLQKSNRLFLFKYFAYKRFFEKRKFKTISSIDENSPRIKSILDAAKSQGTKTIGIQHGTIHDLHPAYILTKQDNQRDIHPDYTLVWGDHWAEFLISKGKYPDRSIITTGQIRTDIIPALKDVNRRDYLDIANGNKIVMFASQPQRDPVLREKAASDVFSAVKDFENSQLVVKLHPAERNGFTYYRNLAKKANCHNFRIVLDFDLYLLISISDIVVTCFSTVGAETVYFDKPLIILDHLKQDIQHYYREGIAFQASNSNELNKAIKGLLSGETKHNKNAYREYIRKYAYCVDGKASERVLNFIVDI